MTTWTTVGVYLLPFALIACAVDASGISDDAEPVQDMAVEPDLPATDRCPDDPDKVVPGACGCGVPDIDSDGDGSLDCDDDCPTDGDKVSPGGCGCGTPDLDEDSDGALACDDCDDSDPNRFPGATDGCGGVDEDCDGTVDEACAAGTDGCADGTREGFIGPEFPDIAACDSAWSVPGVFGDGVPSCDREAGNDGIRVDGIGCDIDDGCAEGWHVCESVAEIDAGNGGDCNDSRTGRSEELFVGAIPGEPGAMCADSGANNVYGCGVGGIAPRGGCGSLDVSLLSPCLLGGTEGFDCSDGSSSDEALHLVKGASGGGVLCCRDEG